MFPRSSLYQALIKREGKSFMIFGNSLDVG